MERRIQSRSSQPFVLVHSLGSLGYGIKHDDAYPHRTGYREGFIKPQSPIFVHSSGRLYGSFHFLTFLPEHSL